MNTMRCARAGKAKLQRLCGEYRLLKGDLLKKRLEIIELAGELGLSMHIDTQMEW